jgi:hypothetical protein
LDLQVRHIVPSVLVQVEQLLLHTDTHSLHNWLKPELHMQALGLVVGATTEEFATHEVQPVE